MGRDPPGDSGRVLDTAGTQAISDGQYAQILQVAADAIVTVDEAQNIVHINRGAEQIFGYECAEVVGQPLGILLPSRYRVAHVGHVEAFGQSDESSRLMGHRREVYGRRKDGTDFPAEASILKLDAPGGGRLYTAVVRDVTDRKRLELQQKFLAEISAALGTSLDHDSTLESVVRLPVPLLADACILDVLDDSGAFRRLTFGRSNLAELSVLRERFTPGLDSPAAQVDVARSGRTQVISDVSEDWLNAHCDEAAEAAHMRALDVRSMMIVALVARTQPIGVLTFMAVHTARRYESAEVIVAENFAGRAALAIDNARLYRDAQRATHARDNVLGVVSHDLRNPLSAIAMCSRVLLDTPPADGSERRELARTIYESTTWMSRMIQDLLDVSAIEAGVLSVEFANASVGPILSQAADLFARAAAERNLHVTIEADPAVPLVRADAHRLAQAVANLIGNAVKFTPPGGRVVVTARALDECVEIAVQDTGRGITDRDLPHIFDRYWHSRGPDAGAGLGLAIVKGIIEAHGGRIDISSIPGIGSRFALQCPRAGDTTTARPVNRSVAT